jgi:hypothetical protein
MQLDYIENINTYGENMVRLYDFDKAQAMLFRADVQKIITKEVTGLDTSTLKYIKSRNCRLIMRVSEEDEGISTEDRQTFYCDLSMAGYRQMDKLLEPFSQKETKGHQWLYDVDTLTDFLFSPGGTW